LEIKNDIWNLFLYFYSASSTQIYLKNCYASQGLSDKELKSFENCYPFIYYIEHAQVYYTQAASAPLSIQPILSFYGFIQLLKACLLTIDPNYPESTSVLAHGVTTRKRKKQQYEFTHDEVKVQKNGLFTYMAEKMFSLKHLDGERYSMGELMKELPELDECFQFLHSKSHFKPLTRLEEGFSLPSSILNPFHMTSYRFKDFLETKTKNSLSVEEQGSSLILYPERPWSSNFHSPIHHNLFTNKLVISTNKESSCYCFPELLIHYLLLYNLSMIARYETEWWSELNKTMANDDFPFIAQFLNVTLVKGPHLVYQWLTKDRFINN
jgi:hypothetical protein